MTLRMRSGVRPGTHKNLFIGPGAIYLGFKSPTEMGTLLGATKGGNKISIKQEWHDSEIDGALGPVKGARWLTGEEVELETSLLEMSLDNLKMQLPGAVVDTSNEDYDVIHQTDDISLVEYYDIAIVGELVGKKKPIIFLIKNAVATEPLEVDTGNGKDDVVLKVKFTGTYSEEEPTTPPYKIYYPRENIVSADIIPVANPTITGTPQVGETLTAVSGYSDANGDVERGTTYAFFTYNPDGTSELMVQPASETNTYVIKDADVGKIIKVKVIPKNDNGVGLVATSQATGVVQAAPTQTEPTDGGTTEPSGTDTTGTEGTGTTA